MLFQIAELFELLLVYLDVAVLDQLALAHCEGFWRHVLGSAVELYLEGACDEVVFDNQTSAFGSVYDSADLGSVPEKVGIRLLFVFQAAHQSAAGARNLDRGEGKSLLLRHFD